MIEVWKPVVEYEESYEVSSLGRVRSIDRYVPDRWRNLRLWRGKVRKLTQSKNGYMRVQLHNQGNVETLLVHRLAAKAFKPNNNSDELQINHINGIKTDNSTDNLEWVTAKENYEHAVEIGLTRKWTTAERKARSFSMSNGKHHGAKRAHCTHSGQMWKCAKDAAKAIGIPYSTLVGYLNGRYKNKTTLKYI